MQQTGGYWDLWILETVTMTSLDLRAWNPPKIINLLLKNVRDGNLEERKNVQRNYSLKKNIRPE